MKKALFFAALLLVVSCGKKGNTKDVTDQDSTNTTTGVESNYPTDSLIGEYVGGFGNSTIIISVNYINGKKASGYNILKGNRRNIKGEISNAGKEFNFRLSEPGGDPYDGIFQFSIDTATRTLKGTWTPYDSVNVKSRKYALNRRKFAHEDKVGAVGTWYLNGLQVVFKEDKSGVANGFWWNEKSATDEQVEIPFSWFEEKSNVSIEWGQNNIFLSPKMKFKYVKNEYEEFLQSNDYIMYRY